MTGPEPNSGEPSTEDRAELRGQAKKNQSTKKGQRPI